MTDGRNGGGRPKKTTPTIPYAVLVRSFYVDKTPLPILGPSIAREEDGSIYIRVVKSVKIRDGVETKSYDYFRLAADGLVLKAPYGYSSSWKGTRIGGIQAAILEYGGAL